MPWPLVVTLRDADGKELIRRIFQAGESLKDQIRVVYLEEYDMALARLFCAGVDLWLNTPQKPQEASGTSGMKAVLNGGLNLSILDGWWAEAYDGTNGWAIDGAIDDDHGRQDHEHAVAMYDLLEHEVAPLFYDRDDRGIPHGWIERIRASLRTCAWRFTATRMMRDYATGPYRG
jgi:glycogen phosphorylase